MNTDSARFVSTRAAAPAVGLDEALVAGLAPDGGLYVPQALPHFSEDEVAALPATLPALASQLLAPFFAESRLREALPAMCEAAYAFAAPLRPMRGEGDFLLELFHGPTAAFKDFAARFLAEALSRLREPDAPDTTILVATSGDTGAAVASAFHRRPGFRVVILYPKGRVSPRQAQGLECWGDNIHTFRVAGHFDDCQRMAKTLLADAGLRARLPLSSANSISLGRLLPQLPFHAHAALTHRRATGEALNLVIPSGNLGNAAAAWLARALGLPVGEIVLACNANHALPDFFAGGDYAPHPAIPTLANAMDVGAPSNFERLLHWQGGDAKRLRRAFRALSVDDAILRGVIASAPQREGIVPCPHTACGLHALRQLHEAGNRRAWAVAATAHPAKFEQVVEPLLGETVPVPASLAAQLQRPAHGEDLPADPEALRRWLLAAH